jgi:hypothetical protein
MPTSKKTNDQIVEILKKYLTTIEAEQLFAELSRVPGNSSFQTTIKALYTALKQQNTKSK